MKQSVVLSIRGRQTYLDQEPEIIELVTEGVLEQCDFGWKLSYEESDLTGMAGVTTTFRIEPQKITLTRTGKLNSEMVFQEGVVHESLYKVEFGALMLSVCASKISTDLSADGGVVDLVYSIEIEQSAAGTIDYHLEIRPK
ncbi:MAG: DUF1934 domain-containing protein [Oscillospiraceae bacterium]|nr:DUF1934 domain-containing protein [Oscillospiraceae bacterium]